MLDKVQIVYEMAQTGEETDECLERGVSFDVGSFLFAGFGHQGYRTAGRMRPRSRLTGIDFGYDRQLALLSELGWAFGGECR
jgi:hypothetical protein